MESRPNSTVLMGPHHLEVAWYVAPTLRPCEAGLSWATMPLAEREVLHEMLGSTSPPRGGELLQLLCPASNCMNVMACMKPLQLGSTSSPQGGQLLHEAVGLPLHTD
ncbi:hypothetical protein V6N13_138167 [Hibiscus sabdariffa]|uniref:Uncharacterized protein n=1 Tax=Hibiscus sabdariffa TaxID=183260 RepID=A0ABR2QCN7_9ROSI